MKAATSIFVSFFPSVSISIHAAREGGDAKKHRADTKKLYISIHAAREGGDLIAIAVIYNLYISIHAAREGGDDPKAPHRQAVLRISIHAAREGGDPPRMAARIRRRSHFNPRRP